MQELQIQNSKQLKEIHEMLNLQYGFTEKIRDVFLLSEKKQKLYIFTHDMVDVELGKVRIDSMGLYFGAIVDGQIRLSIEGSQIIGPRCTKNIIELEKSEMQTWIRGDKITLDEKQKEKLQGFVIIKYKNDYLGAGKVAGEILLNYIPKTRYVHADYE